MCWIDPQRHFCEGDSYLSCPDRSHTVQPVTQRNSVIISSHDQLTPLPFLPYGSSTSSSSDEELKPEDEAVDIADICDIPQFEFDNISTKDFSDIQSICVTYLIEEAPYMEDKRKKFFQAWGNTNLGEDIMNNYIDFAKNRKVLPFKYLPAAAKQIK